MDGLRGLAILLVVLFHYWQLSFWAIPIGGDRTIEMVQYAGFLGVELFFFISGFCLFYPYAKGRVPTLKHFYYRRAIKIVPSYLLALFVFAFVITDLYPSTWEHGKFADLGMHLLFLHNFTTATHGSFNGVMWSLAVEVQFYLLFPLIAWGFRRRPFLAAAAMVGISIGYRAWNRSIATEGGLGLWADLLPAFLDLFAFGMLAAWVMVWIGRRHETAEGLRVPFTAIALLAATLLGLYFHWVYSIRFETAPGIWQSENRSFIGALFMVLAVASAFAIPQWRAALGNRGLVFLSTISYNLYLWHQAIGVLVRKREWWPADTPIPTDDPTWRWSYTLVAVALSVLVATLITYLFERPLLRNGVRPTLRRLRLLPAERSADEPPAAKPSAPDPPAAGAGGGEPQPANA